MHITLIPGFNPGPYTGAGNNTYLIAGQHPTLIDAATGDPRHLDALGQALGTVGLARVLVTHGHSDHAAGSGAIAERWPDAEFLKKPWPDRDARYAVRWTPVPKAGEIPAGDTTLRPIHTPGHAPDHLCFFEEASRTLFCGDLLVQGATVVIPVSGGGSLTEYLASLQQILELKPATVLPAHGPEIEDPAPLIEHYYDHRRRREEQVVTALRAGCTTREALVARIYTDLSSDLVRAASETLWAHLIKLRDEGRVREADGEWFVR